MNSLVEGINPKFGVLVLGLCPTNADDVPGFYPDNLLEERDTGYDAMLSQMVGRIRSKSGGMPEMGEAYSLQKASAGTTKFDARFWQIRGKGRFSRNFERGSGEQIILLYKGKSEGLHNI